MTLLILAYFAGALTIVSPCILPIAPFVFSRAGQPFVRSGLPMLIGLTLAFAVVASLISIGGAWAVQASALGRAAALTVLAGFGVLLVWPRAADWISRPLAALGGRLAFEQSAKSAGIGGSLLLGVATGLVWTPCAGPILGLVLTGAALEGEPGRSALLLGAYGAGAATSLALVLLAGRGVARAMRGWLRASEGIRQGLGVAVLASVAIFASGLDTVLYSGLGYSGASRVERSLLGRAGGVAAFTPMLVSDRSAQPFHSALPVLGVAPPLTGATAWLNSTPLTTEQLRGKVVLIDFWTYSCINCAHTLPHVRSWAKKYRDQGLVVIAVHAPEYAFERNIGNVRRALNTFRIAYPVAVDNDFRLWRAFRNNAWPAHYFIDAKGRIRRIHVGEGDYARSEQAIRDLLAEAAAARDAAPSPAPDRRPAA